MKYTTINFTTDLGSKWGKIAYGLTDEIPRIYNKVKRRRRLLCMMTTSCTKKVYYAITIECWPHGFFGVMLWNSKWLDLHKQPAIKKCYSFTEPTRSLRSLQRLWMIILNNKYECNENQLPNQFNSENKTMSSRIQRKCVTSSELHSTKKF